MDFAEYQKQALQFAEYDLEQYPFMGLAEEVGEFISPAAKATRGDDMTKRFASKEEAKKYVLKEAGDVLWMLAACLHEYGGFSLQDAAEMNIKKLTDRRERGVIKGDGDER